MNNITEFTDTRLDSMEKYPKMWGSNEAIEMQYILLLEMKYSLFLQNPERFLDFYQKFLRTKYKLGNKPLFQIHNDINDIIPILKEFRKEVEKLFV